MHRSTSLWRGLATTVVFATLLSGCGGTPDRADFVAKIKDSVGSDLIDGMKAQHIDTKTGEQLINDFVECQYDSIKDDTDLLQKAYDDPGDTNIATQLDTKAAACVQTLATAMSKATGTTTTTIPVVPDTVPDPVADSVPTSVDTSTTIDTSTTVPGA